MKTRILWVPLAVLIVVATGYYVHRRWVVPAAKPAAGSLKATRPRVIEPPPPAMPFVAATPPVIRTKPIALPPPPQRLAPELILPIQDQATIDFSIGSPVIKRGGADDEAMRRALKEMEEATKNLTIPASKQEPAPTK